MVKHLEIGTKLRISKIWSFNPMHVIIEGYLMLFPLFSFPHLLVIEMATI
jgi:hypothetical protein